jgi:hypothetical protein
VSKKTEEGWRHARPYAGGMSVSKPDPIAELIAVRDNVAHSLEVAVTDDMAIAVESLKAQKESWQERCGNAVAENTLLRKALADTKTAWDELYIQITDDQGFIYYAEIAECVTCRGKASTIEAIVHEEGCLTAAVQSVCAALARTQEAKP